MKRIISLILCIALVFMFFAGCTQNAKPDESRVIEGLSNPVSLDIKYAECFKIDRFDGGYAAIYVDDGRNYLVVPEGKDVPSGAEEYIIINQPSDDIYLVATSAMSLFDALDSLDLIRLSGTREDGWYIDGAREAMSNGDMLYAGKYSAPDYELILDEGCDLVIESTMIYRNPKVLETFEEFKIPVIIDRASYEPHPLGRTEWIKVYGAIAGCDELAEKLFDEQCGIVEGFSESEASGKTIAFFYVTSNGTVSVRKASDYIPKMMEIAGGEYILKDMADDDSAGETLTMEAFYEAAKDADYIIYNASVDEPIESVEDLIEKNKLFSNFKAVKEGNVWCTNKYLYQATDVIGTMILDIHMMLNGENDMSKYTFIEKIS